MIVKTERVQPESRADHLRRARFGWMRPFLVTEWMFEWLVYWLSGWAFLELLEYLGTFSLLVAVIVYFADGNNRAKQRHYQAWQVINTAQGKGGSGGRVDALEELLADHVSLVGVDLGEAFLQGVQLDGAELSRCDLHAADVRRSSFRRAKLDFANMQSANFRGGSFGRADLSNANLQDTDLNGADLRETDWSEADLSKADLRGADLDKVRWQDASGVRQANILGVKHPPPGFVEWALKNGAVSIESDAEWTAAIQADDQKGK
ncbi:MAG TPA: pentapeptide repeat-containing protein [Chthoniobacterales bacterium]